MWILRRWRQDFRLGEWGSLGVCWREVGRVYAFGEFWEAIVPRLEILERIGLHLKDRDSQQIGGKWTKGSMRDLCRL